MKIVFGDGVKKPEKTGNIYQIRLQLKQNYNIEITNNSDDTKDEIINLLSNKEFLEESVNTIDSVNEDILSFQNAFTFIDEVDIETSSRMVDITLIITVYDYESLNNILSSSNTELLNSYDDEALEQSALDPVIKHIFTGWQINQSSEDYNISFLDESGDVELEKKVAL
jgi:hypothetical protein